MKSALENLRNKAEDVQRALVHGHAGPARIAVYELGIRLSHTVSARQLQADPMVPMHPAVQASASHQSLDDALSRLGEAVDHLYALLKKGQTSHAAEAVPRLFELLDALDALDALDGPSATGASDARPPADQK